MLRKTLSATISSSWGKSNIVIRELSLGGGMGTKEDNLRVDRKRTSKSASAFAACEVKCCSVARG